MGLDNQIKKTKKDSKVLKLFTGELESTLKCTECDEPATVVHEPFQKLPCHIGTDTTNLSYGLEKSLVGSLEKTSPTLGKNAVYTKTSKIKKLPHYLTINFVRFYWKPREQVRAKILKNVKFPIILDVYDLCTDDLKKKLNVKRNIMRKEQEEKMLNKFKEDKKFKRGDEEEKEDKKEEKKEDKDAMEVETTKPSEKKEDTTEKSTEQLANETGWYELCGVVTHQGRSADSGHYIGWVKDDNGILLYNTSSHYYRSLVKI